MKVVGFKQLKAKKRSKNKIRIFCFCGVYKKAMIVLSTITFLFIFNIINPTFTQSIKLCIKSFISSIGSIFA